MSDVIRINVPTFLRILELAREEIKDDVDLHDITEIVTKLSEKKVITMDDYKKITSYMKRTGNDSTDSELERIKRLGGMDASY